MAKPDTITVRVFPADKEDVHKGWVRISKDKRCGIASGSYIKLSYGKKSVFTQVRGTPNEIDVVKMSEWYRNSLGWEDPPPRKVVLEISQKWLIDRLHALLSHPDDAIRTSIGLAFISVALGLLGIGFALLPSIFSAVFTSEETSSVMFWSIEFWCMWIRALFGFTALVASLFLAGCGIRAILKSAPKLTDSS